MVLSSTCIMNIGNILPTIQYNTGAGSPLSIDVQPTRIISGRFRIRPKSQYEQKLLNNALMQSDSGIVICQNNQQSFIGGVKVLSQKFSHLSNSSGAEDDIEALREDNSNLRISSHYRTNKRASPAQETIKTSNYGPQRLAAKATKREKSANLLPRHNINSQNNRNNRASTEQLAINSRNNAILHTRALNANSKAVAVKSHRTKISPNLRQSIDNGTSLKSEFITSSNKAIKVFLSQKQSPDIGVVGKETDVTRPSAPPCTPSLDMMKKFNYIPSLSDNMAKQQVKTKLKIMKKMELDKEKAKQAERAKLEQKDAKEREQERRKQQRRAIYALNRVMTKLENDQFERFKSDCGLRPREYPAPNRK